MAEMIPSGPVYGIVGSRSWTDLSAVHRIVRTLLSTGRPVHVGGAASIQAAALLAQGQVEEENYQPENEGRLTTSCVIHVADKATGGTLERDERFLTELGVPGAVLVAFLALDGKGREGRTHVLCDEARDRGITVVQIPAGPATDPAPAVDIAARAERALGHIDDTADAFARSDFGARARFWATVTVCNRLLHDTEDVEERLERQWAYLKANPLVIDFAVREHRSLCLLETYTRRQQVRTELRQLGRQYGDQAPAWPRTSPAGQEVAHAS